MLPKKGKVFPNRDGRSHSEIDYATAIAAACERTSAPSTKACDAAYAKIHYLVEELVTQRSESARLSIVLADAEAKGAQIEAISRQQEALLTALMAALASRDRRDAAVRSEIADLRQRLEVAQAELQHKGVENDRLAAELAAAHKAADEAASMARTSQRSMLR